MYDVIALVKQLGFAQCDVFGYSRGSIITAKLLVKAPKGQVRRSVLGGVGMGFTDPNWDRRRNF